MPTVYLASTKDSKTLLQEYYQARGKATPVYRTTQNPNYEQHTPVFDSHLTFWNGKDFFAKGESKRSAEKNVALLLCKYLDILPPKKALKIKSNIFDFSTYLKSNIQNQFCNSRINGAFTLPTKFNSVVAFIPPKFKGQDRNIQSHRLLATLGSNYVYLLWYIAKRELVAKTKLDKVQKMLPIGFISTFFMTGIITPDQFPFKGSDVFLVRSYREDCIQALFGLSLLTLLDRGIKLGSSQLLVSSVEIINPLRG